MCNEGLEVCVTQWKSWIRPLAIFVYALAALVFVPIFLVKSLENGFNRRDQEILVAGVFVWVAIPLSLWQILQHVIHYTQPMLQKYIVRILWMVPIYALNAWLGLVYPRVSIVLDSLRECYEAYVIYNFMTYLLSYLNIEMDLEASLELKPQVKHIFPLCCLPDWKMGREFVEICKHGILQYTVFRPLTTVISVICKINGMYGDGQFHGDVAFPYILAINNLSQFVAMYCLVMFYKANRPELRPMKPLAKFLCIKAVVFFSFFQAFCLDLMVYLGIIKEPTDASTSEGRISARLQDFLICIEMCLASIAHHYSFSYKPYVMYGAHQSCCSSFMAMWDLSDVHRDVQEHIGIVSSSISRRVRGKNMYVRPSGSDNEGNQFAMGDTFYAAGGGSTSSNLYQGVMCDEFVFTSANKDGGRN